MNTFVSLTDDRIVKNQSWGIGLQNLKATVLARGEKACGFPGVGMSIDFSTRSGVGVIKNNNLSRAISIFLVEDLPAACATLQHEVDRAGAGRASIRISISSHIGAVSNLLVKNGYPTPDPKLSRCLTPLGRLRGVKHVEIHGLVSSPYKSAIIAAMCDHPLTVAESMELIGAQIDQGDKASMDDHWESAILAYKAALHAIHGVPFRLDHSEDVVIIGGRFHGQRASRYVSGGEFSTSSCCQQHYLSHSTRHP